MQRLFVTACFLLLITISVHGQNRMSLDSIFSSIERNHPLVKMYDADIRSMDEAAKGARSWMAPEVGTGLYMVPYNTGLWKKSADGMNGMGQYMISAQQMFPNKKEQDANARYMQAMSSVNKETKQSSLNELYASAKKSYYDWMILEKKLKVLDQSEHVLNFMIQSAELRYKNNLGKLNAYYKAQAAVSSIQNQRIMIQNEVRQQKIMLNTLMNRDKLAEFEIDTIYQVKTYDNFDSSYFLHTRSDLKAIDRNIELTYLQQSLEKTKLKPQFGIKYDHMFGFGGLPMQYSLMAMMKLPLVGWSSKTYKANIESLKWKAIAMNEQKQIIVNEALGMSGGIIESIKSKEQQVHLYEQNIIPALRKNFQVTQLSYEQNTSELFELFDAWETLNMTQMEYLEQLRELLNMQVQLDKILEQK